MPPSVQFNLDYFVKFGMRQTNSVHIEWERISGAFILIEIQVYRILMLITVLSVSRLR